MATTNEIDAALEAIKAAEAAGRSDRHMNKLWKKLFALQDAR